MQGDFDMSIFRNQTKRNKKDGYKIISGKGKHGDNGNVNTLKLKLADYESQLAAISKSLAVIEFNMDGTIITANENFLNVVGYSLDEIQGKHHSIFVTPEFSTSAKYRQFWEALNRGEFQAKEYSRIGKGGKEIWIQASYNPIFDFNNKPYKIVKYATDITEQKLLHTDYKSQLAAISKSQAVIEFNMDGTIITANENFLNVVGYSLDEIQGKHHSIFVTPEFSGSAEYREFWEALNRGEFQAKEYSRIGKGGKEIWIQASYNPIFDFNNKPYKVVKYATDITEQKLLQQRVELIFEEVRRVLLSLADGVLTDRVEGKFEGEFAVLQEATNKYCNKLSSIVNRIKSSASSVSGSSNEINQGNANLSQRTEEQAANLEETASSMEEITTAVKQNADNAKQANELVINACEQAESGGKVVGSAMDAMSEINDSSKKIADIIGVIDEIAFQTNLLALNASVEAARAGEQGRGFAVVASEVRNLAGRSATAAKEIKELIEDSVVKVKEGSKLVNESGGTLEKIVGSVKKVTSIIAEITSSSQEQARGIEEVNKAILQMDDMTQQNAALVEQAAAASDSMNKEAKELSKQIGFFTVNDEDTMNVSKYMDADNQNHDVFEDRRSADRPWSETSKTDKAEPVSVVSKPFMQKTSGSDIEDHDWQEF